MILELSQILAAAALSVAASTAFMWLMFARTNRGDREEARLLRTEQRSEIDRLHSLTIELDAQVVALKAHIAILSERLVLLGNGGPR